MTTAPTASQDDTESTFQMSNTFMAKKETVHRKWYVCDADNQIVGRLASKLATILMGKHKPTYTPHVDTGDCVVVVNARLVRMSGMPLAHDTHPYFTRKLQRKEYDHYTGYPSGRKVITGETMLERNPEKILYEAVRRMLPKNKLGRQMLSKLKLYAGPEHPHQAQDPQEMPAHLLP